MVGETFDELKALGVRFSDSGHLMGSIYLIMCTSDPQGTLLALALEICDSASGVQGCTICDIGRLRRLGASDVKTATERGRDCVLLGEQAEGTHGSRAGSSHCERRR
jgi:hypothetical protein